MVVRACRVDPHPYSRLPKEFPMCAQLETRHVRDVQELRMEMRRMRDGNRDGRPDGPAFRSRPRGMRPPMNNNPAQGGERKDDDRPRGERRDGAGPVPPVLWRSPRPKQSSRWSESRPVPAGRWSIAGSALHFHAQNGAIKKQPTANTAANVMMATTVTVQLHPVLRRAIGRRMALPMKEPSMTSATSRAVISCRFRSIPRSTGQAAKSPACFLFAIRISLRDHSTRPRLFSAAAKISCS